MDEFFPSESDLAAQVEARAKARAEALESDSKKRELAAAAVKAIAKAKAMLAEFVRKAPSAGLRTDEPLPGRPDGTWYRFEAVITNPMFIGFYVRAEDATLWGTERGGAFAMISDELMGTPGFDYELEQALVARLTGGSWK